MTAPRTATAVLPYEHEIPGGAAWSVPLRAGRTLTLTAGGPRACVSTLVFAADRLDRMNLPDTLKAQMSARITAPMVLMSDRGAALASVVDSTVPWHDALGGLSRDTDLVRFGPSDYQQDRNDWRRGAREMLLLELAKHGLGEADLHGPVNFFAKAAPTDDRLCSVGFVADNAAAGDTVTLRAEQDLLIVLATAAHPLDDAGTYAPAPISARVALAPEWGEDDPSYRFRPESARALDTTRKACA
ncbi:DUF1989 domain-containing protein [Nakamurella flavida]|uniref:DUF1989 domain-containing protein n=1 Tax=Nakamurella flavida TaxID=363630 RepID=A0A938YKG1_9ACTN|nr:DUF1989 domain-containing protein [Nakamurella flavida]MBM9476343.1 DUF1989 domain-containing protein [Nakamurella flavida]MDP9779557.1 urea carboxylase-associated protein 2 [Nakamurella flavida]